VQHHATCEVALFVEKAEQLGAQTCQAVWILCTRSSEAEGGDAAEPNVGSTDVAT
jgi:hypothetical protein